MTDYETACMSGTILSTRAGTNTPSDEYDTYREYRVANTNMYSRIHFFSEAKLGNGLSVLVYACTMYSAQKFHFANLVYYRYSGVEIALIRLSGLSKNVSGQVDCPTEVIRRTSR